MNPQIRVAAYLAARTGFAINEHDDIFKLGLVNSLFAMQLVMFVEQEFGISVEGEDLDLDNFCSVRAISAFVTRKLATESVLGPTAY